MINIHCPLCNTPSKKIKDYLFNVDYDSYYLGKPNILNCKKCNLSFVDEPPEIGKLDYYYTNIYRAKGRPHYRKPDSIIEPAARHYLSLINILPFSTASENRGARPNSPNVTAAVSISETHPLPINMSP